MNNYYDKNAQEFINETFNCDMSELYKFFEEKLNNAKTILDLGFGSGRDSLYFKNKGYEVYSIDPIKEFCDNAKKIGLNNVYQMNAQDIEFNDKFDGIWACASLLHIPSSELNDVFKKCAKALKKNGIMYISFKLGEFEGERNKRFFNDMNKDKLLPLLDNTGLTILEEKITIDVRPDKSTEWYNVILKDNKNEKNI